MRSLRLARWKSFRYEHPRRSSPRYHAMIENPEALRLHRAQVVRCEAHAIPASLLSLASRFRGVVVNLAGA